MKGNICHLALHSNLCFHVKFRQNSDFYVKKLNLQYFNERENWKFSIKCFKLVSIGLTRLYYLFMQGSAKLEKAEILQMTVDHLKMLQATGGKGK